MDDDASSPYWDNIGDWHLRDGEQGKRQGTLLHPPDPAIEYHHSDRYIIPKKQQITSVFMEDRKQKLKEQRKGLFLPSLSPKPRPMWMAQAFYGFFGVSSGFDLEAGTMIWDTIHAMQQSAPAFKQMLRLI